MRTIDYANCAELVRKRPGAISAMAGALALTVLFAACAGSDGTADAPPPGTERSASGESTEVRASVAGEDAGTANARDTVPVALLAGTSLTAGLGLDPSDAYPAVLQRMADSVGLPVRVLNRGLSGETSAGLVRRLPWLLREHADVVMIETGANDGLRGLQVDSTRANLVRAVRIVRDSNPNARVLLVQMEAPPNLGGEYTARFRAMFREVAEVADAVLVPFLLEGVAGERELNQADGIHPNEEGARRAAETVWPAFEEAVRAVARMVAEARQNQ